MLHSQRKHYPPELGAHIAVRTVRRFLEQWHEAFDGVVLVAQEGTVEYSVYKKIIPLYFPRTRAENEAARVLLPADTGNELGTIVLRFVPIHCCFKMRCIVFLFLRIVLIAIFSLIQR